MPQVMTTNSISTLYLILCNLITRIKLFSRIYVCIDMSPKYGIPCRGYGLKGKKSYHFSFSTHAVPKWFDPFSTQYPKNHHK